MEMDTAANCGEDDDWQLVNDDGFVYKRQKKRPCLDPSSSSSSSSVPPPPPPPTPSDQELQRKNRMERKKIALLKKVRGSYQREILQWEQLSNTLSSMQQKPYILPEFHGDTASSGQPSSISFPSDQLSDPIGRQLMDELLLQAEAQETIIEDAVNVCEIAEAIFRKKERQFKLLYAALPVWDPRLVHLSCHCVMIEAIFLQYSLRLNPCKRIITKDVFILEGGCNYINPLFVYNPIVLLGDLIRASCYLAEAEAEAEAEENFLTKMIVTFLYCIVSQLERNSTAETC